MQRFTTIWIKHVDSGGIVRKDIFNKRDFVVSYGVKDGMINEIVTHSVEAAESMRNYGYKKDSWKRTWVVDSGLLLFEYLTNLKLQ